MNKVYGRITELLLKEVTAGGGPGHRTSSSGYIGRASTASKGRPGKKARARAARLRHTERAMDPKKPWVGAQPWSGFSKVDPKTGAAAPGEGVRVLRIKSSPTP